MKYRELKQQFESSLQNLYDQQESSALFFIALEKAEGSSRMQFLEKQHQEVDPQAAMQLFSILEDLGRNKPIQYILGETLFYNLTFKVNEAVLIPRDETEQLVDLIIKAEKDEITKASKENLITKTADDEHAKDAKDNLISKPGNNHIVRPKSLLDVGTGSGCIAVSLKKNLPWIQTSAIDISAAALAVAKENALINDVDVDFIEADALTWATDLKFDIIVSNPPYIMEAEREAMHNHVLVFEPHTALFVSDADPLIFYRAIADLALKSLNAGGMLYFEINEQLGAEMVKLLADKGFKEIELIKDLQQKDRMLSCKL